MKLKYGIACGLLSGILVFSTQAVFAETSTTQPQASAQSEDAQAANAIESIALDQTTLKLNTKLQVQLKATVSPEGAEGELVWKSSDEKVAKVSELGLVTPVANGNAKITVQVKGNEKISATCQVTVQIADGLAPDETGILRYYKNGKVDTSFNGFAECEFDYFYVKNGTIAKTLTSVVSGTVGGQSGWWYVHDGRAETEFTGIAPNEYGWWAIKNGKVDFGYNGFMKNDKGWWYLEGGHISFAKNSVVYGKVNGENAWWLVRGSHVEFIDTLAPNDAGWWAIKNGKVDFGFTGLMANDKGWRSGRKAPCWPHPIRL